MTASMSDPCLDVLLGTLRLELQRADYGAATATLAQWIQERQTSAYGDACWIGVLQPLGLRTADVVQLARHGIYTIGDSRQWLAELPKRNVGRALMRLRNQLVRIFEQAGEKCK